MFKKIIAALSLAAFFLILAIGLAAHAKEPSAADPQEQVEEYVQPKAPKEPKCVAVNQFLEFVNENGFIPLIAGTEDGAGVSIWVNPPSKSFIEVMTNPKTKIACLISVTKNVELHPLGAPALVEGLLGKKV